MNTNEMDDFELFGGEAPVEQPRQKPQQSQQGGAPQSDPSRGSRSTLAETAAAVARGTAAPSAEGRGPRRRPGGFNAGPDDK